MVLALIGLLLTVMWLVAGIWYVAEMIGLENFLFFLPGEIGQFLTGFMLPLALLWLVLGYLHFAKRLRRLEEGLWQLAARRRQREEPDEPQSSSGGGSWLDRAGSDQQGGGHANPKTGSVASAAEAQHSTSIRPVDLPRQGRPSANGPARGGGLATEIFTTRMRDRMASAYEPAARAAPSDTKSRTVSTPVTKPRATPVPPPSARDAGRGISQPPSTFSAVRQPSPAPVPVSARESGPPPSSPAPANRQGNGEQASPKEKSLKITPVVVPPVPQSTPTGANSPGTMTPGNAPTSASRAPSNEAVKPIVMPKEETADTASKSTSGDAAKQESGEVVKAAPPKPTVAPTAASAPPAESKKPANASARPLGFRHLVRITSLELNGLAMDLSAMLCRDSDHAKALKGYDKGEKEVFFHLLHDHLGREKQAETIKRLGKGRGDPLVESYLRKFETLAEEAKGVDRSGALGKSLEAMPIGRLYGKLQALQAARTQA